MQSLSNAMTEQVGGILPKSLVSKMMSPSGTTVESWADNGQNGKLAANESGSVTGKRDCIDWSDHLRATRKQSPTYDF
jgi:hypothetical protein